MAIDNLPTGTPSSDLASTGESSRRLLRIAQWAAWLTAWAIAVPLELIRWRLLPAELHTPLGWFHQMHIDSTLYVPLLILAPLAWRLRWKLLDRRSIGLGMRRQRTAAAVQAVEALGQKGSRLRAACLALLVGSTSLAVSAGVGSRFDNLPPAYHDEYSYLFQAKTFLAGQVSFPSHPAPRLFDQMHVLNEGRFASRYFPGTGVWMMPFVALGHPVWGHWLAGAICAVLIFLTGRELSGDVAGVLAGLLTAVAPGMAIFSNLLLAHHPALVGLSLFLYAFFRMLRTRSALWAILCGSGLTFAALCRPMTAAGIGLPFGLYLLAWLFRGDATSVRRVATAGTPPARIPATRTRLLLTVLVGVPVLAGGGGLFAYSRAITGSGWETPYAQYLKIYTPRHVYGFNNVVRGERHLGPRVIRNYDEWAENLTAPLAARNVVRRFEASWQWTLGLLPLAMSAVIGIVTWRIQPIGWRLILASIASLHIVHIPYWYDGILHYHYIFESGPLWALWFGGMSASLLAAWRAEQRNWMPAWLAGLVGAALLMNYATSEDRWTARISGELQNLSFARNKHGRFVALIRQVVQPVPALVLVDSDPSDRHIDYVINDPPLNAPVLIGRYLPEQVPLEEVQRLFPERSLFVYRARDGRLVRIR